LVDGDLRDKPIFKFYKFYFLTKYVKPFER